MAGTACAPVQLRKDIAHDHDIVIAVVIDHFALTFRDLAVCVVAGAFDLGACGRNDSARADVWPEQADEPVDREGQKQNELPAAAG